MEALSAGQQPFPFRHVPLREGARLERLLPCRQCLPNPISWCVSCSNLSPTPTHLPTLQVPAWSAYFPQQARVPSTTLKRGLQQQPFPFRHLPFPAGARLERLLPRCRRVILPDSGHAALLERGVSLAALMRGAGFAGATSGSSGSGEQLPVARGVPTAAGGVPGGRGAGFGQQQQQLEGAAWTAGSGSTVVAEAGHAAAGAAGPGGVGLGSSAAGAARKARRRDSGGSGAAGGSNGSGSDAEGTDKEEAPPDDSAFDEWCQKLSPWRVGGVETKYT